MIATQPKVPLWTSQFHPISMELHETYNQYKSYKELEQDYAAKKSLSWRPEVAHGRG